MPGEPTDVPVEATIVVELLARPRGYPRAELYAAIKDVTADRVTAGLTSLEEAGVVRSTERTVHATDPLKRLDRLGLVCI